MTQHTLFEKNREPLAEPPRARATDPATSHAAAERMTSIAKCHREMVLDLVFRTPGLTAHELAEVSRQIHGDDYLTDRQINKRLTELKRTEENPEAPLRAPEEKQRKCKCKSPRCAHYKAQTWWPV